MSSPNGFYLALLVSEGGLEPPPSIRGLAPQASASTIPPPGLPMGKSSTLEVISSKVFGIGPKRR